MVAVELVAAPAGACALAHLFVRRVGALVAAGAPAPGAGVLVAVALGDVVGKAVAVANVVGAAETVLLPAKGVVGRARLAVFVV